jgi:hypothetical protein
MENKIVIKKNIIYDNDGNILKKIYCDKAVTTSSLTKITEKSYICGLCEKAVMDTSLLSSAEIMTALRHDPNYCVMINRVNPIFDFRDL